MDNIESSGGERRTNQSRWSILLVKYKYIYENRSFGRARFRFLGSIHCWLEMTMWPTTTWWGLGLNWTWRRYLGRGTRAEVNMEVAMRFITADSCVFGLEFCSVLFCSVVGWLIRYETWLQPISNVVYRGARQPKMITRQIQYPVQELVYLIRCGSPASWHSFYLVLHWIKQSASSLLFYHHLVCRWSEVKFNIRAWIPRTYFTFASLLRNGMW